jgi:hypothetical protein
MLAEMTRIIGLSVFGLSLVWASSALAQPNEPTLPVSRIRPGQTGYGLTVFKGFEIERFDVQVVDVLRNFLPKQDIIVMRGDHPVLRRAGVLGGMSGSPIYIDGKLVGALAYGWRFSKEPVFGVTPIRNMFELLDRDARGPDESLVAQQDKGRAKRRAERHLQQLASATLEKQQRWWRPMFSWRRPPKGSASFTPLAVPLNVAGVSASAMPQLHDAFRSFGFEPVRGGGTGRAEGPKRFSKGGAIGVQMVSGDISMSGTGTVTWTNGKRVLGFGHPMFNAGEIYLPVVSARINHSLASLARSFKLSSPARVLGALVHDRQPGIVADTSLRSRTIPMSVTLRTKARSDRYRVELARHRLLTPSLVMSVVSSAIGEALPDVEHLSFDLRTRIALEDHPDLVLDEQRHSASGLRMGALMGSRGLNTLRLLVDNPFEPIQIKRVDVDVRVVFGRRPLLITAAEVASNIVEAGEEVPIQVTFRPHGGDEFSKTYRLRIPEALAGSIVVVDVASGDIVRPQLAPPEDFEQLVEHLQQRYPARSLVLSLETAAQGVTLRGRVIRNLPTSVVDSLDAATSVRREKRFYVAQRKVIGTSQLIAGRRKLRLRVKDEAE